MVGEYNARNALAALIVSTIVDLDLTKTLEFLAAFKSVKRRQEVRAQRGGVVLIEDFAHHPTAVRQTLQAVKEAFPGARITAIFEPRSNTSRRKVFQTEYIEAFKLADLAILKDVTARSIDQGLELIDVSTLSSDIARAGVMSVCLPDVTAIRERLWSAIEYSAERDTPSEVVVVMSNGSFDGLNEMLQADLEAR
jgi:UDP-N-acetylmuramate: L-alanyl-gamma-D-glutamyl-meso-diaminopimelate ligase